MKKETFLKLLTKRLSGNISDADGKLLEQALAGNDEYRQLGDNLNHYFQHRKTGTPDIAQLAGTWEKIRMQEQQSTPVAPGKKIYRIYPGFARIAAVLLIFLGIGFTGYYFLTKNNETGFVSIATGKEKVFHQLTDGTKLWLNRNTGIRYTKAFGKHKREIFLEGEAYFDVARNPDIPLVIHAGDIDIEVKGTAFNVNAYKLNPDIQVSLVRGSIEVSHRLGKAEKVLLRPNQKLIYSTQQKDHKTAFRVVPLNLTLLSGRAGWTSDTLIFRKERLEDLALRMEKKYDLKIEIRSEQLKDRRFSGTFTVETIQEALEALRLSYPLTYTINDRLVIIKD